MSELPDRVGAIGAVMIIMLDLDQGTVTIENTRVVVKGHATDSDGKTEGSRRTISLDPFTVAALRQFVEMIEGERDALRIGYPDHGMLMCFEDGRRCSFPCVASSGTVAPCNRGSYNAPHIAQLSWAAEQAIRLIPVWADADVDHCRARGRQRVGVDRGKELLAWQSQRWVPVDVANGPSPSSRNLPRGLRGRAVILVVPSAPVHASGGILARPDVVVRAVPQREQRRGHGQHQHAAGHEGPPP